MALPLLLLSLWLHPPALTTWPETPPALSDLSRFPSFELCQQQLAFFDARRKYLDAGRELYREPRYVPWFEAAVEDCKMRREPWETLNSAHYCAEKWQEVQTAGDGTFYTVDVCHSTPARKHLAELRRLLGARAYNGGQMPFAVGVEYWRRAD